MFKVKKISFLIAGILIIQFTYCLNASIQDLAYLSTSINSLTHKANKLNLLKKTPTKSTVQIVDYNESYKANVIELVFQDPDKLFGAGDKSEQGQSLLELLEDANKIKRVLVDSNQVIGFIEFFNVKKMKRALSVNSFVYNFGLIEALSISQNFRRKGYGKLLLKDAIDHIKKIWPTVKLVIINVQSNNKDAIRFYESEGFMKSAIQPGSIFSMDADFYSFENEVQLEKYI